MKNPLCAVLALMLLATACATTRLRTEFDDVPLPTGLTYQPQRSVVIESPSVKAAKLVYRGRLEPASLGLVMRAMLESNGWRHVNTTTAAKDGTRQVYEKRGNALEVHISEGLWFTYLVIGISETLLAATSQRSEEHTSELQSPCNLVCRLLLEKKKQIQRYASTPSL